MDKNLIIRLGVLLFSLLNIILTACGKNPLPVSESMAYEIISIIVVIAASVWNAWKNNNFTAAAKLAQKLLDAIKTGKITAEKVDEFLKFDK